MKSYSSYTTLLDDLLITPAVYSCNTLEEFKNNKSSKVKEGDILYESSTQKTYIYLSDRIEEIGSTPSLIANDYDSNTFIDYNHRVHSRRKCNCINCNAILPFTNTDIVKCEYCGTVQNSEEYFQL